MASNRDLNERKSRSSLVAFLDVSQITFTIRSRKSTEIRSQQNPEHSLFRSIGGESFVAVPNVKLPCVGGGEGGDAECWYISLLTWKLSFKYIGVCPPTPLSGW